MIEKIFALAEQCSIEHQHHFFSTYDIPSAAHVAGTCRMGDKVEKSVTNSYGQVHGVENLSISDASILPTLGAGDSPSLTIQALALRIGEWIAKKNTP